MSQKLIRAIGDIRDDFIDEAAPKKTAGSQNNVTLFHEKKKKLIRFYRPASVLTAAAILLLVTGAGMAMHFSTKWRNPNLTKTIPVPEQAVTPENGAEKKVLVSVSANEDKPQEKPYTAGNEIQGPSGKNTQSLTAGISEVRDAEYEEKEEADVQAASAAEVYDTDGILFAEAKAEEGSAGEEACLPAGPLIFIFLIFYLIIY